jgi:hypothetical protein
MGPDSGRIHQARTWAHAPVRNVNHFTALHITALHSTAQHFTPVAGFLNLSSLE